MSSIFELTGDYLQILDYIESGEYDEEFLLDALENIKDDIHNKADNYARIISTLEGNNEMIDKEIERLTAKKKSYKNNIDFLKKNLQLSMEATNQKKFKTPYYSFSIAKNGQRSLVLDCADEFIPNEYKIKQPDKIDTKKIKALIKSNDGEKCEFAHFAPSTYSLRIK